jgi:signal peptidase II
MSVDKATRRPTLLPFVLTLGIILLDQFTKLLIIKNIPLNSYRRLLNDFVWIVHARNLGIAFSIGDGFPELARRILFILLPLIVMVFVVIYYLRGSDLTLGMRWTMAGILGGGLGNLVDRIGRPLGVVDYLSVKFYGIFGLARFPAFNVADSSIVVSGILLVFLFILQERRNRE